MNCQCTHEQGDSDCGEHPTCHDCGADLSGQLVKRERDELRAKLERAEAALDTVHDLVSMGLDADIRKAKEVLANALATIRQLPQTKSDNSEFWSFVEQRSDQQRQMPDELRELSGVPKQPFDVDQLPTPGSDAAADPETSTDTEPSPGCDSRCRCPVFGDNSTLCRTCGGRRWI